MEKDVQDPIHPLLSGIHSCPLVALKKTSLLSFVSTETVMTTLMLLQSKVDPRRGEPLQIPYNTARNPRKLPVVWCDAALWPGEYLGLAQRK